MNKKKKEKHKKNSKKSQSMISVIITSALAVIGAVTIACLALWGITGCTPSFLSSDKVTSRYIQEISMDRALEIFDDGEDALIFFGYEDCPYCQKAKPVLKKVAEEYQTKVYYVKTRDVDKKLTYTDSQRESLENYIGSFMEENPDEDNKLWLYVPLLVYSDQGVVTVGYEGTGTDTSDMTRKELKELRKEYIKIFNKTRQEIPHF